MLTAYSRVTVVSGARRVDLALPSLLPVADVVPQVLRFCLPDDEAAGPQEWGLAKLGGPVLPLTQSLHDAGVLDGEVLELRTRGDGVRPAFVEDVRDTVEDTVDASGGVWSSQSTVTFSLVTAAVVLFLAAGSAVFVRPATPMVVTAAVAVVLLVAGTWWSGVAAARWAPAVVAVPALLWGFLLGAFAGRAGGTSAPTSLLLGALGLLVAAAACGVVSERALPHAAAAVPVAVVVGALAVVDLASADELQVVRLAPVLCLLVVGVLPRVSLSVGGLASADYQVRHAGRLTGEALRVRFRRSADILLGALVGLALVVAVTGAVLTYEPSQWDRYLGLSVGAVAVLRSRVFSRVQQLVPLRVAAVVVAVAQLARLGRDSSAVTPWVALLLAGAAVAVVLLSAVRLPEVSRARLKRTLNWLEFILVVDMVVVCIGALGVFDRFSHVGS